MTTVPPNKTGRRPPKLRSSCDACGNAKVRCNKEHPQCERCASIEIPCVYSESRKFGKAPRRLRTGSTSDPDPRSRDLAQTPMSSSTSSPVQSTVQSQNHRIANPDWIRDEISLSTSGNLKNDNTRNLPLRSGSNSAFPVDENSNGMGRSNTQLGASFVPNNGYDYFPFEIDLQGIDLMGLPCSAYACENSVWTQQNSNTRLSNTPEPRHEDLNSTSSSAWTSQTSMRTPESTNMEFDTSSNSSWTCPSSATSVSDSSEQIYRKPYSITTAPWTSLVSRTTYSNTPKSMSSIPEHTVTCNAHDCSQRAYSTLENLQFRPETSSTNGSNDSQIQTLDDVLSRNRAAIKDVLELLECPCSHDPHLAMLYGSITSKILICYQVAAGYKKPVSWSANTPATSDPSLSPRTHASSSANSTISSLGLGHSRTQSTDFAVMPMQITIGTFSIDEKDQEFLRKQLLLSEVKKSGQLIDVLNSHGAGGWDSVDNLYATLGVWLRSELAKTIRILENGVDE